MAMADLILLRQLLLKSSLSTITQGPASVSIVALHYLRSNYATAAETLAEDQNYSKDEKHSKGKWFTLPPFTPTINASALGKQLASTRGSAGGTVKTGATEATALKWVLHCCPQLPRSLVQKLFRLRQVRRESSGFSGHEQSLKLKRVAAKEWMNLGDRIFLPNTVRELPSEKQDCHCNDQEVDFIRGLELYKDSAIVVVNKPRGMPVQGGIGIKRSLDELAATCLRYDYSEPPRLVHRLDRDSSGVLVLGRTQTSATVLHSIFREKTFGASNDDFEDKKRILQKRYWALVIGSPRRSKGLISAPLGKVVMDNGKSDRITVIDNVENMCSQHAVTQYRVIESSSLGYTWLELSPLTGRKHQLRVHCAEVLGTPIVGDYKYGWQAHRNWKHLPWCDVKKKPKEKFPNERAFPFGLDLESGSVSDKDPCLHLHCKQMVLPNVTQALQAVQCSSDYDFSQVESLELDAPLPLYMQRSWDILNS